MSIKRLTIEQIQRLTSTRKGEVKIGERVQTLSSDGLESLKVFQENGARFCLLGIPECIGVLGNHGNPGAQNAWEAFLMAFLNVQSNRFLSGNELLLLGEIDVQELQGQAMEVDSDSDYFVQKMHIMCERLDALVSPVIKSIVEAGLIPVVIGGGHNNAYPILKGLTAGLSLKSGAHCINLDAHADYRSMEGRHSGNGFSYAKNDGYLDRYFAFGLHQSYNGENMLKALDTAENVGYHFLENIDYLDKDLAKALEFVHDEQIPCGIELDMDVIRMMPSSAISPTGFSLEQARQFVRRSAEALCAAYLHLPEAAPQNDLESKLVGKSLAYLVTDFVKATNKKAQR